MTDAEHGTIFPDVVSVPPDVLTRHRIRLLDPATAVRTAAGEWPLSTAYRADRLLMPAREVPGLIDEENEYNKALDALDMALEPSHEEVNRHVHEDLPVPVPLVARNRTVLDRPADPWSALVALRRYFGADTRGRRVGLDHLTVAASVGFEGAPVNQGGAVGGVPVNQGGSMGNGRLALHTGSRNPVAVLGPAPVRRRPADLPHGRRPVVAVLDTGMGPHPWLTGNPPATDPVVELAPDFQAALAAHEGTGPGVLLGTPDDEPDRIQPLLGLTDSHSGHGTFCAGLVHQLCPDARILSLRVLHPDGYSTESSVLFALDWLRARVESAIADGRPDLLVDVVSLSLGFYPETADPAEVTQVSGAIQRLTDLGVLVVSASGNDATTRPFVPAAFGMNPGGVGNPFVAAVGALNAAGDTTAAFSNHGPWVWRWAPGDALVSTVPTWQGAGGPGLDTLDGDGVGPRSRTAPDPDDLRTGFAVWAGTSFATPVVAGLVATALIEDRDAATSAFGAERARRALAAADRELSNRKWR
ncbi:MAG TPA: S8/S53 family peptidase [Actinophytocola sp.]|nr:S8/S53 family peptidase [Actinophytocola sp.]